MADSNWPLFRRDRIAPICGEIALGAILTGVATAAPAALRAARDSEGSTVAAVLSTAGPATALAAVAVLVVRAATLTARTMMPQPEERAISMVAISIWLISSSIALALFATVLSSVTHHRGLGGTTFALIGLGTMGICALFAWRLAHLLGGAARHSAVAWGAITIVTLAVGSMVFSHVSRAPSAAWVGDAVVFAGVAVAVSRIRLPNAHKKLWVPGMVVLLLLFVVAALAIRGPQDETTPATPVPNPSAAVATVAAEPRAPTAAPKPSNTVVADPVEKSARVVKPDIVVITLDTVRADHLGAYGYERKTSPNLDALGRKSAVFERAYAVGPETRTALAPLVTCKHLVESYRDERGWPTLLSANDTVAERLRAGGYATGAVSSFQWVSKARGFDQGFDVFDERPFKGVHPEKGITGARAVAQAMSAYDELRKADKPLFLWVHLFDAHAGYSEHDAFDFGNADVDRYDGEIAYLDHELSRLVDHIRSAGRESKTVWIVHGSHGEAFGEHGFRGHPPKLFDEVVRVPLMVHLPWAKPIRVQNAVVSVLDVPATVLSLSLGKVDNCSGTSLVDLSEGTTQDVSGRPMLLVAYDGLHGQAPAYGWLDQRVKYVLYAWREGEKTRLFDLRADPKEESNLQAERPGQAIELRKQLDAFLKDHVTPVKAAPEE